MSAREEAKAAADKAHVLATCNQEAGDPVDRAADAASDVWEPLLRELTHLFEWMVPDAETYSDFRDAKAALDG
jgi:hypothetical protein